MAEPVVEGAAWRPPAALQPYVSRYVGYRHHGLPPGVHRGVPSPALTLIVSLGPPVHLAALPDPAQPSRSFGALVAGLHRSPATIVHDGRGAGVQVELTPLGARAWLGLPAGELASAVVDLDAVLGGDADRLADRLRSAATWAARFAILDGALDRAVARHGGGVPEPRAELTWAWRRVVGSGGLVEVGALAADVGWSRRHLAERFSREFGLAPKVAGRVARFARSRRLLERHPGTLADVAAACGYFDQAHMNRDWHEFAGCSPSTWAAEELPTVVAPDEGPDG